MKIRKTALIAALTVASLSFSSQASAGSLIDYLMKLFGGPVIIQDTGTNKPDPDRAGTTSSSRTGTNKPDPD